MLGINIHLHLAYLAEKQDSIIFMRPRNGSIILRTYGLQTMGSGAVWRLVVIEARYLDEETGTGAEKVGEGRDGESEPEAGPCGSGSGLRGGNLAPQRSDRGPLLRPRPHALVSICPS
jgi:hypothetical protein